MIDISHNTFTEDDSPYGMDCGNETDDRVYLFSYTEAMAVSDDTRNCGVDWWVRSPGKRQDTAVFIGLGSPDLMGTDVGYDFAIRPAIRVRYSDPAVDK